MPRSSESVAALASALAQAQAELVNPEKLLTATIPLDRTGQGERSFRYASLASGLEIIRKTLGKHEIASMQTTAIDQDTRMVNLTTTLAHSSGEWIASDWPVCPLADMAYPRRMGAALTYARRYALFTLVGIAGEDDLDAPDLMDSQIPPSRPKGNGTVAPQSNGGHDAGLRSQKVSTNGAARIDGARSRASVTKSTAPPKALETDQSVSLRDALLAGIAALASTEDASEWARTAMPKKNSLNAADAKAVENAFEQALPRLVLSPGAAEEPAEAEANASSSAISNAEAERMGIDKSVLAFPEPRRLRNREHLRFVARQACLICGRQPCDAHHIRYAQPRALGRKSSDEFTVPLCRIHHRAAHRVGNERAFWNETGIDPMAVAHRLWQETCGFSVGPSLSMEIVGGEEPDSQHSAFAAPSTAAV